MTRPPILIELTRGNLVESVHAGHAAICDSSGSVIEGWGDPVTVIYPRSSCKMMQALPLVESGAADAAGLTDAQLALACASHEGAALHADAVRAWLARQGQGEDDLLCGTEMPRDRDLREALIRAGEAPCQVHNNCSGKHAGFLTLTRHLKAGPDYVALDHPVQKAVRSSFEEVTGLESPGYGIDGCSAPNFATTVAGLATAMARFAAAGTGSGARDAAMARLTGAMIAHPDLVAGQGRACTELMRAAGGAAAVKTGAEAVFVAILPRQKLGVALKIVDGGTRAAEAAIAALLVHLGVLAADDPAVLRRVDAPIMNRAGLQVGQVRRAAGFP
ncbi:asparaginase [Profundibacterium mesophilum]|uniref:L-asparaginase n=1 Tax=Profundibacterium mesophilum KAUST100406-0324 TaxID=1037889 RepID=A0A921TDR5_9RHOB|nr:asparaginase [Profundibacterium mesophilum]KAF0676497.1 L-asparaginase [Profundibacterium mesophilum KAUST100406-0324]